MVQVCLIINLFNASGAYMQPVPMLTDNCGTDRVKSHCLTLWSWYWTPSCVVHTVFSILVRAGNSLVEGAFPKTLQVCLSIKLANCKTEYSFMKKLLSELCAWDAYMFAKVHFSYNINPNSTLKHIFRWFGSACSVSPRQQPEYMFTVYSFEGPLSILTIM